MINLQKNVFDKIFDQNWFSGTNFNFSEPSEHSKHQKYGRQQHGANMVPEIQKHTDLVSILLSPYGPFDLANR